MRIAREEAEARGEEPDEVSIEAFRLHDLRRTAAVGMKCAGERLEVIEEALGHTSGARSGIAGV
jgi:integrase